MTEEIHFVIKNSDTVDGVPTHLAWLIGAAATGFLVPFLAADCLALSRNLFVAVHAVVFGAFLFAYHRWAGIRLSTFFFQRPLLGLLAAMIAGGFTIDFVLTQPRPPDPLMLEEAVAGYAGLLKPEVGRFQEGEQGV